jgi:hypothetical protein
MRHPGVPRLDALLILLFVGLNTLVVKGKEVRLLAMPDMV